MDVQSYIHGVGRQARTASRVIAKADTATKNRALEAMAAGVPVVAADAGSLPEVLGDAALLVDPTDAEALAEAMDRALTDEALRRLLVARGAHRAERYDWDTTARELMALYTRLAR